MIELSQISLHVLRSLKPLLPFPLFLSLHFSIFGIICAFCTTNGLFSTIIEDIVGEIEMCDKFEPSVTLSSHLRYLYSSLRHSLSSLLNVSHWDLGDNIDSMCHHLCPSKTPFVLVKAHIRRCLELRLSSSSFNSIMRQY